MRWTFVPVLMALAACQPPIYKAPGPKPIVRPPDPPETVLRIPADFRARDHQNGLEYLVRRYTAPSSPASADLIGESVVASAGAGEWYLDVVTVVDLRTKDERLATPEEHRTALELYAQHLRRAAAADALYLQRWEADRARRESLIDARIALKERVLADLKEERFALHADVSSIRETPGYQAPAGRVSFLERQIALRDVEIAEHSAQIHLLKYQRHLRDARLQQSMR